MKKTMVIVLLLGIIIACNSGDKGAESKEDTASAAAPAEAATDPEVDRDLALVAKSDCFTCHKVVDASTGPAYEAVAARYPDNDAVIDSISKKIITGGSGNWGTVPMTPHPDISEADAKAMTRYVLSLK